MNNRYEVFRHKRRWFVIDNKTGAKTMCRTIHDARELCATFVRLQRQNKDRVDAETALRYRGLLDE
jgi:hypothetical protein